MVAHVKKFHSEAAKRKAEEDAELFRLELLHANKVPRLGNEEQTGGAVTRGMKRSGDYEETNPDVKRVKNDLEESEGSRSKDVDYEKPLFQANIAKMGTPKKWKKGKVIDQKFTFTLDYMRGPKTEEDVGVEAVHALTIGMDNLMEDMEIDAKHHNCLHANCPSCMRRRNKTSKGCPDYTGWSKPTITCRTCCRSFYGEDCYRDHLIQKKQTETRMEADLIHQVARDNDIVIPRREVMKSVCEMHRKCNTCLVSYKVKEEVTHKCGHGQCSNCLNYVELYNHQCFIMNDIYKANKRRDNQQKAEKLCLEAIKEMTTEDGKKVKDVATRPITVKENEVDLMKKYPPTQETIEAVKKQLKDLEIDVTDIPEDELQMFQFEHFYLTEGKKEKYKELVFADIECCIDVNRKFTPNLICFERESSDKKYHGWGRTCLRDFHKQ